MTTPIASTLLTAALLLVASHPLAARPAKAPHESVILVASETGAQSVGEVVILTVPMGNGSHFGFVLNQPTDTPLSQLFPEEAASGHVRSPVHVGGPALQPGVFAVVRGQAGATPLPRITPELSIALNSEDVDAVIAGSPGDARYFVGLVLWMPGQLAEEIKAGAWQLRAADANLVMSRNPASLWPRLSGRGVLHTARIQPDVPGASWTLARSSPNR